MQEPSLEPFVLGPPPPVFIPPLAPVAGAAPPSPSTGGGASSPGVAVPPQPPKASPPSSGAPNAPPKPSGSAASPSPKPSGSAPSASSPKPTPTPKPPDKPAAPAEKPAGTMVFPLWTKPTASWKDGYRYFGAPRSGGTRKHAGCDLYAPYLSKIRAIADGVVILAPYYFYDGTNALEVFHPGIGVVRYGEISSGTRVPLRAGDKVACGQHIAYVGLLDSLQMHMIHFELFDEAARGQSLSGGGPYRRNPHLRDPTALLDKLHKLTFG